MSEPGQEERPRSVVERAEDLVVELEERVAPAVGRLVGGIAEFFEDVWAEAQHVRRKQRGQGD